jgi:hypothetical protein
MGGFGSQNGTLGDFSGAKRFQKTILYSGGSGCRIISVKLSLLKN